VTNPTEITSPLLPPPRTQRRERERQAAHRRMDYAHVMTSTTSLPGGTGSTRDRISDESVGGRVEMATGMSGEGLPPRSDAKAGAGAETSTSTTDTTTGTGTSSGRALSAAVQGVFAPHDNGPEGCYPRLYYITSPPPPLPTPLYLHQSDSDTNLFIHHPSSISGTIPSSTKLEGK
jgi:hypothetical protein